MYHEFFSLQGVLVRFVDVKWRVKWMKLGDRNSDPIIMSQPVLEDGGSIPNAYVR